MLGCRGDGRPCTTYDTHIGSTSVLSRAGWPRLPDVRGSAVCSHCLRGLFLSPATKLGGTASCETRGLRSLAHYRLRPPTSCVQQQSSSASRAVRPVSCGATSNVTEPGAQQGSPAESRGSIALKLGLVAFALVSTVVFSTGSVQGLKASANKSILGRSGFLAAFSLIFLSEIGDKTFFIAGLLATRVGKWRSLIGSTIALAIMTVISVSIGSAFNSLPDVLKSSLPIGQYLGAGLMLIFGIRTILDSLGAPGRGEEEEKDGELHEAELSVSSAEREGKMTQQASLWKTLVQVGTLIFLAEWGDRSMLATIALGASHPPAGVAVGATLAHAGATSIAVVGSSYVSKYVSERTIGLVGGALFLLFAALTFLGYF